MMHLRLVPVVASYLAVFARAADNGSENTLHDCILAAVGEDPLLAAFQGQPFYQTTAVKPYNFNWPVEPAAVASPKSSDQVASVVKCAADRGYKVQPKSGGHSYANYGMSICQVFVPRLIEQDSVVRTAPLSWILRTSSNSPWIPRPTMPPLAGEC